MAVISELPGGSNDDDPNKNPDDKKNVVKKPQDAEDNEAEIPKEEEEENQNEEPQVQQVHVPEELIETLLALVPRSRHALISLVSKAFRRFITSPYFYKRRSELGVSECFLYALVGFYPLITSRWYRLDRVLRRVIPLPLMPCGCAVVTVGTCMYVIGGHETIQECTSSVILIDCTTHLYSTLPSMQRARSYAAAGVIDGKIYVIGGCEDRTFGWGEVFDLDTLSWSPLSGPYPVVNTIELPIYTVLEDKLYVLEDEICFAYEPREDKWETWGSESVLRSLWRWPCCVIDDLLYTIDFRSSLGSPIVVYDPTEKNWRPVEGLDFNYYYGLFYLFNLVSPESRLVNFGGKLVIMGAYYGLFSGQWNLSWRKDVWCAQIGLERREGGEIWGSVESVECVLAPLDLPFVELCRTVLI